MGGLPIDYIFSYSTGAKTTSSLGFIRLLETMGTVLATLMGGLFLDYLNKWVVIIISCILYIIAAVPLLVYYFYNRNTKGFNTESTSNATESLNKSDSRRIQHKMVSRFILRNYFAMYILLCFYDFTTTLLSLYIFKVNSESYSLFAYVQMSYSGFYGIGSYIASYVDQKHDLSTMAIISCFVCSTCIVSAPFLASVIGVEIVVFAISGFFESFTSLFLYSRMVSRCKILGISNESLHYRKASTYISQGFVAGLCTFGPFMFIPGFCVIALASLILSLGLTKNEEVSRKMLVDYLQENSI